MLDKITEKIRYRIWCITYGSYYSIKYWLDRKKRRRLNIMSSCETCAHVLEHRCSVCRFGDGELQIMEHWIQGGNQSNFRVDSFQGFDGELAKRLCEVFTCNDDRILICLPYPFKDASVYSGYDRIFFMREYLIRKRFLSEHMLPAKTYGDTDFTRFYLHRTDIKDYESYIKTLKSLWRRRNVLIVEGEFSRIGVGNDLFDNTLSIERILCPAKNAFSRYDEIIQAVLSQDHGKMVILALGQTATVMACDLAKYGIQALDLGHIDIEYEWYMMGAKNKVAIADKYVNEVSDGRISSSINNQRYQNEIICRIQ